MTEKILHNILLIAYYIATKCMPIIFTCIIIYTVMLVLILTCDPTITCGPTIKKPLVITALALTSLASTFPIFMAQDINATIVIVKEFIENKKIQFA